MTSILSLLFSKFDPPATVENINAPVSSAPAIDDVEAYERHLEEASQRSQRHAAERRAAAA